MWCNQTQFDANTSQTEQTHPCNMLLGYVPEYRSSVRTFWETSSVVLDINNLLFSFTVFSVCKCARGPSPLNMFCARCICKEHSKLNFNRFALAFTRLACPWVEHRPPSWELRAQHLLTTVRSHFLGLSFTILPILAASSYSKALQINGARRQSPTTYESTHVLH